MRKLLLLLPVLAVLTLALAGLAAACGDDGGDSQTGQIRTQQGLSVAALSGANAVRNSDTSTAATADSAGVPAGGGAQALPKVATGSQSETAPGAPAPAPQAADAAGGITVQGYGSATADADTAIVEFYFSRGGVYGKPVPLPGIAPDTSSGGAGSSSGGAPSEPITPVPPVPEPTATAVQPITEAELQPVIDAITGQGVARSDIEFIEQPYYDPYNSNVTLRATVKNVSSVDAVVQAATNAAGGLSNIYMNGSNVAYTVSDCTALEKEAMKSAVADAKTRAAAFAEALGVGLGGITAGSDYSFAPYGGTPCNGGYWGPYPMKDNVYAGPAGIGGSSQVQVAANISVTFAIQ